MSDAQVIYSSSVEGLIRALGAKLDDAANARFKAIGMDLRGKLQPAYEWRLWVEASKIAGELLFPMKSAQEQQHLLGRRFMTGFSDTLVGKAMVTMMRVVGPKRTLERVERNFRMGNNYSTVKLLELEPDTFEMLVSPVAAAEFYQGLIEAGLELSGGRSPRVDVVKREGESATFHVSWS